MFQPKCTHIIIVESLIKEPQNKGQSRTQSLHIKHSHLGPICSLHYSTNAFLTWTSLQKTKRLVPKVPSFIHKLYSTVPDNPSAIAMALQHSPIVSFLSRITSHIVPALELAGLHCRHICIHRILVKNHIAMICSISKDCSETSLIRISLVQNLVNLNTFGGPIIKWVVPYQFTKVSHMTLSELDETWWVGSPSELM